MNPLFIPRHAKSILKIVFCALGALVAAPFAQATNVTINLGQAAQNLTLNGLGANGSGLGQYLVTLGSCNSVGSSVNCTLSGSFTGASPGFTSGTYSLVTSYISSGGTNPFQGIEQAPGSNLFSFSAVPSTGTITLTLVTSTGTTVVPVLQNNQFVNGATVGFIYGLGATCTVVSPANCSVAGVGAAAGSSITGQPTGSASFNVGSTYYFSDFAFSGGYQTTLTYVNYSQQSVTCTTSFYGDNGLPVSMPFTDQTSSVRTDIMPPGGSLHVQTQAPLAPPFVQGWAQATCTGPVEAGLLYRYFVNGTAVGEASVNAETAPTMAFATFAQTATGIAYANPSGSAAATVNVQVYGTSGLLLGSKIITLGPLQHGAANVGPLLGLTNFTGFVKITSNIPIITLSLNAEAFPVFSSLPPGDLPAGTVIVP